MLHHWTRYLIIFAISQCTLFQPCRAACWGCKELEIQHIPPAVTSGIINSSRNIILGFRFLLGRRKQGQPPPPSSAMLGRKINDVNAGFSLPADLPWHPAWFPSSSSAIPRDGLVAGEDRLRKERISTGLNYFSWKNKLLTQLEASACLVPPQLSGRCCHAAGGLAAIQAAPC